MGDRIRAPRPPSRSAAAGLLALLAILVIGCAAPSPTPSPAAVNPSVAPATALPSGTPPPTAPPSSSSGATPGASASVPIDPSLMAILPSSVGSVPVIVVPDPSGTDDPGLVSTVERMVEAQAIDPSTGEFAYASVIILRPGVFDDGFYRSWRDSFDAGACSQAGGVTGHAQATIGGRTTYIGRCAGGVMTYHVRLDQHDAIVSVSSLGASRMGEQLVTGLRP